MEDRKYRKYPEEFKMEALESSKAGARVQVRLSGSWA